jgi:hypothetical protein
MPLGRTFRHGRGTRSKSLRFVFFLLSSFGMEYPCCCRLSLCGKWSFGEIRFNYGFEIGYRTPQVSGSSLCCVV